MRSEPRESLLARALTTLRHVPRKAWLRLGLLAGLLAGGLALVLWTPVGDYFTEERMIAVFEGLRDSPWTPLLLIALYVIVTPLGFIPVTPLVVAGGLVFGWVAGTIYNILGLVSAAMAAFYVARTLGREFVERIGGPRLRRGEKIFHRQGFWALVHTRFLPIPFSVVSYGAAISGVPAALFFTTTAVGVTPATVIHTYFMPELIRNPRWLTGFVYMALLVALNVVVGWQGLRQQWLRRRRYREILEVRRRAGRGGSA